MNAEIINVPDKLLVIATDVHSFYPHCAAKTFANVAATSGRRARSRVSLHQGAGRQVHGDRGEDEDDCSKCEMKDRTPR